MEYLNGSDAIKIIRKLEKENKIKKTKIITASCEIDLELNNNTINMDSDIVLSKPISKSKLIKAFQDLQVLNV